MSRQHYNEQNMMVSPAKVHGEEEEMAHSDAKKSRNRHLVIINQLRKKEESWNGRFYLEHIPAYNCIDDKNCETYKKMLVKKKSKNFVLRKEAKGQTLLEFGGQRKKQGDDTASVLGGNKRPESQDRPPVDIRLRGMYPSDIRPREKIRAESMKRSTADNLLREKKFQQERLLATWDRMSIPMFHREAFLKCENLQNLKQTIEIIKRELDEIETNCSSIQLAIKAVTARENCLKQLRTVIQQITQSADQETVTEEEIKQRAQELLTHLRLISLNVIETIMRWREYIHNTYYSCRTPVNKANHINPIPFIYNQFNYFNKMKADTKDLVNTPLAKYFAFSTKSDPLFIEIAKETEGKITVNIHKNLVSRIKACDFTLQNESTADLHSPITPPIKINGVPSESGAVKKNNIKIRNTSLTKQRKEANDPYGKGEKGDQAKTNSSHPSTQNNLTDGDIDAKAQGLFENPSNLTDRLQAEKSAQPLPSPKENKQPEKVVEKVPEKVEKVEKVVEKIEETKPVEEIVEDGSSAVQPVDRFEDEMEEYLNLYLQKIDQNMRESFLSDPKVLLERANMGQDPVWFELVSASGAEKKKGLAVAHIDNTVFTARRMVILHFTAEDRELYGDFLSQFVEYLWKNDECNEIKISLYHLEDQNGNFGSDKNLEQSIKKLGFRWKQLTNDKYTGKRYIDYMLKRPEGAVCTVAKLNDEPIHVESCVVVSDLEGETNVNRTPKCLFDNRYAVLSAALKHCEEKLDKLGDSDTKRGRNYLQVISSLVREGQKKIGELTGKFQNLEELQTFIKEKLEEKAELAPKIDSKYSKNIFSTSLLNLAYRWKSFNITNHKVQGKDRRYLKINNNGDLVQFQSKYKSSSVYFLPTDDNEVNIFLTDNDAIVNEIINKEEIIEESVSKLFSKLEKTPTTFKEDLWVPLFSLKEKNVDLEDAKSLLQGEYKLNYATSACEFGLNGSRVRGNLKVRPSEKSKIIEKPFLLGIVHEQVDFPLFSVVVQPQDFMQFNA